MTHFSNAAERQVFDAILLLRDNNLVWSADMEAIRPHLVKLLERIMQVEWHYLEAELDALCLNLITERENDVRRFDTTE